jgi:hypothetical protein
LIWAEKFFIRLHYDAKVYNNIVFSNLHNSQNVSMINLLSLFLLLINIKKTLNNFFDLKTYSNFGNQILKYIIV